MAPYFLIRAETTNCPYGAAVYSNGAMTVLRKGTAYSANQSGTVGGSIILDPNLINYYPGFYWLNEQATCSQGKQGWN